MIETGTAHLPRLTKSTTLHWAEASMHHYSLLRDLDVARLHTV